MKVQGSLFAKDELLLVGSAREIFLRIESNRPDHNTPYDLYIHVFLVLPHPFGWRHTRAIQCVHSDFCSMHLSESVATYEQCVREAREDRGHRPTSPEPTSQPAYDEQGDFIGYVPLDAPRVYRLTTRRHYHDERKRIPVDPDREHEVLVCTDAKRAAFWRHCEEERAERRRVIERNAVYIEKETQS